MYLTSLVTDLKEKEGIEEPKDSTEVAQRKVDIDLFNYNN